MITVGLCNGRTMTIKPDRTFDLTQVTPFVIGHGLARVNRFSGQTQYPYSVAEHSVHLYDWAKRNRERPAVLAGLLIHDGPECLGVGDVQRFVKRQYAETLRGFDHDLTVALWQQLKPIWASCIPWDHVEETIHRYDSQIGSAEAAEFGFPYTEGDLPDDSNYPDLPLCWNHEYAQREWIKRWREIK